MLEQEGCECMECKYVTAQTRLESTLNAKNKEEFIAQFRHLLSGAKSRKNIVYIWQTVQGLPRLRGESPIIYIGKTVQSLYSRYSRYIKADTEEYWERYLYIMENFGPISIHVYESSDASFTENIFLYQYHKKHLELPPLNLRSFNREKALTKVST